MTKLNAYLFFDGTCADAMRFYERVLDGKIDMMMTYAQSPMPEQHVPGAADRIMHASVTLADSILMASDSMPGFPYMGMSGFSVSLSYPTADEARAKFAALAEGGQITVPLEKTFWSEVFGMLIDKFGTPWIINGAPATT